MKRSCEEVSQNDQDSVAKKQKLDNLDASEEIQDADIEEMVKPVENFADLPNPEITDELGAPNFQQDQVVPVPNEQESLEQEAVNIQTELVPEQVESVLRDNDDPENTSTVPIELKDSNLIIDSIQPLQDSEVNQQNIFEMQQPPEPSEPYMGSASPVDQNVTNLEADPNVAPQSKKCTNCHKVVNETHSFNTCNRCRERDRNWRKKKTETFEPSQTNERICSGCTQKFISEKYKTCERCKQKKKKQRQDIHTFRGENNEKKCCDCKKLFVSEKHVMCQDCRDKAKQKRDQKRQQELEERAQEVQTERKCVRCPRMFMSVKSKNCDRCRELRRNRANKKKSEVDNFVSTQPNEKMCYMCKTIFVHPTLKSCEECRRVTREKANKRNHDIRMRKAGLNPIPEPPAPVEPVAPPAPVESVISSFDTPTDLGVQLPEIVKTETNQIEQDQVVNETGVTSLTSVVGAVVQEVLVEDCQPEVPAQLSPSLPPTYPLMPQ